MSIQGIGTMSGGTGSWAANNRWAEAHGAENLRLVFTDVKGRCPNPYVGEDIDTYRFLVEASAALYGRKLRLASPTDDHWFEAECDVFDAEKVYPEMGLVCASEQGRRRAVATHAHWLYYRDIAAREVPELAWMVEGRSIHDVFEDNGWLGNSSLSHCSWELKTKPARTWMADNFDPASSTVIVGMDWTETRRHAAVHHNYAHPIDAACKRPAPKKVNGKLCSPETPAEGCCTPDKPCRGRRPCTNGDPCATRLETPWPVVMPMNDKPRIAKPQVLAQLRDLDIAPPRLYSLGFAHANCLGCVKAGQAHWRRYLEVDPLGFAYHEARENEWQASKENRADNAHLKETAENDPGSSVPLPLSVLRERVQGSDQLTFDMQFDHGCAPCGTGERPDESGAA